MISFAKVFVKVLGQKIYFTAFLQFLVICITGKKSVYKD